MRWLLPFGAGANASSRPPPSKEFDAERGETVRLRSRWILAASIVIWVASYFTVDLAAYPSREVALAVRGPEVLVSVAVIAWLGKRRTLRQVETVQVLVWIFLSSISVWGLTTVSPERLPAKVASLAVSVLVVCPLAAFTWQATALIGVITVAALSTLRLMGQGTLLTLVLTVVGFGYGVLIVSAAARDRLKRAEFDARQALAAANERLRKEDELRRRFFVNLSHDFRTPLGVIRGEASLLRARGPAPEEAAALFRVEASARALADLAEQLLELARLEAGQVAARARRCDVGVFARDVAALLEPPGAMRRIVTVGEGADVANGAAAVALVDPSHLQRMLVNLVANALRHSTGDVTLRTAVERDQVVILVVDDGPGVPPSRRGAIFDRFVSFAPEGSVASGIGLPLARELAELNGGTLVLREGSPTTFEIALPRADGPAENVTMLGDEAPVAAAPPGAPAVAATESAPRVLVVEDNDDMAQLFERVLSPTSRVERARSVAEALARLANEAPAAVLSDVMLPDGTGYDVLAAVRGSRLAETVPVIFASALGEVDERVRGLAAGADDYIAKPFAPEELRQRVQAALQRATSRRRALDLQRDTLLMEIHDGVSASLARAAILLGDPAPEAADFARDAIRDGLDEVRAITRLLSPRAGDWRSLVGEIRRATSDALRAAGVTVQFDVEAPDDARLVPAAVAHTLRRIVREATTNIVKHAAAKSVNVTLSCEGAYVACVADDGRGLPPDASDGHGLGIMRRRVERLGGALVVEGVEPTGVRVKATLPHAS